MKMIRILMFFITVLILSTAGFAENEQPLSMSNVAGTETRLLPANIDVWSADWSPDGKSLVFSGKMQGEPASKMRIWHWPLDPAQAPMPLTNTDGLIDGSPRWSPDGNRLLLTRRTFNTGSNISSSIWLKEVQGGAGRQLTNGPQDRDPVWAPDGKQIVFTRDLGPYQSQLMIMGVGDSSPRVLAGVAGEILQSPWWGTNNKVYYTKQTPCFKSVNVNGQTYQVMDYGRGSIWAIEPETQKVEAIVNDGFDNRLPVLSPDATKLAFISDRSVSKDGNGKFDRGSLYLKDLATGQVTYIANKVGLNGGALSWSPDGKKLAFFTFRSIRPAVWMISLP